MRDWSKQWTHGPCESCGKTVERYRGLCSPCRFPKECRQLVEYGVPGMSARGLMFLARKSGKEADKILRIVHPRLMENVKIVKGIFKVIDKKYRWVRSNYWAK